MAALYNCVIDLKIKHPKLMLLVNAPFIMLGLKPPFVKLFISVSKPRMVKVES